MTVPFKLKYLTPERLTDWLKAMPDGDYTVGRGADPRSAAERAADPDGSIAMQKRASEEAAAKAKTSRRKRPPKPQAAE